MASETALPYHPYQNCGLRVLSTTSPLLEAVWYDLVPIYHRCFNWLLLFDKIRKYLDFTPGGIYIKQGTSNRDNTVCSFFVIIGL